MSCHPPTRQERRPRRHSARHVARRPEHRARTHPSTFSIICVRISQSPPHHQSTSPAACAAARLRSQRESERVQKQRPERDPCYVLAIERPQAPIQMKSADAADGSRTVIRWWRPPPSPAPPTKRPSPRTRAFAQQTQRPRMTEVARGGRAGAGTLSSASEQKRRRRATILRSPVG